MKHLKYVVVTLFGLSALLALAAPQDQVGPGRDGSDDSRSDDRGLRGGCVENVRGDGTITVDNEGKKRAQFHVRATENDSGGGSGRLDFRDRNGSINLRSSNLISYEVVDTNTRRLTFDLGGSDDPDVINTAVVTLRDLGRRGRNDFFEVAAGDYLASGNLRGGQVRIRNRGRGCDDSPGDQ